MPGAEQLAEIREVIEHDKVACIFSEPQFNPDIINAVAKDMDIKTGVLDPLGATLSPGKTLYFDLIVVTIGSFLSSYFTIVLLMKFIQKISFLPFMIYRIVLGIFLLVFFV